MRLLLVEIVVLIIPWMATVIKISHFRSGEDKNAEKDMDFLDLFNQYEVERNQNDQHVQCN